MTHLATALAAAVLLVIVFMAAGAMVVSTLAALIAAALFAWVAYRVARTALMRAASGRAVSRDRHPAVRRRSA